MKPAPGEKGPVRGCCYQPALALLLGLLSGQLLSKLLLLSGQLLLLARQLLLLIFELRLGIRLLLSSRLLRVRVLLGFRLLSIHVTRNCAGGDARYGTAGGG